MNRLSIIISMIIGFLMASANDYIESYNIISDKYDDKKQDVTIIRPINGGTVLIPIFDDSCPEELKAPFSFACKIVEEYMPTCLPLKIKVSCGRINSSTGRSISKVLSLCKENFGNSIYYHNAQMSVIKGVILAELCNNTSVTYLNSVPNVEFLTKDPDISITYNNQYLDEISFSLEPEPDYKYDFVSLVIRDLLIGLGMSHSYRYNPLNNGLQNPSQEFTPFEKYIDTLLGNDNNPSLRLEQATKGELILKKNLINGQDLKLYAPSPWIDKTSLNYFIPLDDCCVSSILSYNFCKGHVTRSLSDVYSDFFFKELLGWKPDTAVGTGSFISSFKGNTSLLMPYNGSLSLNQQNGIQDTFQESVQSLQRNSYITTDNTELNEYLSIYNPINPLYEFGMAGHDVSILKKDGSWDVVEINGDTMEGIDLSMSDWKFNFDSDEYARTIDGYLRAKITIRKEYNGHPSYKTTYFVIDYLPQRIFLNYSLSSVSTNSTSTIDTDEMVRIHFSNTEGLNRIVLERLRLGARVPSKIEIPDFKKGYYDTTIDRTTTFTAVGYNANGTSRSIPITITPTSLTSSLNLCVDGQYINIQSLPENGLVYRYEIRAMPPLSSQIVYTGTTTGQIDISSLPNGLYSVTVFDDSSTAIGSLKLKK